MLRVFLIVEFIFVGRVKKTNTRVAAHLNFSKVVTIDGKFLYLILIRGVQ